MDGVDGVFEVEYGVVGADEIEAIVGGDAVVFSAVGSGVGTEEIDGLDDRYHVGTLECVGFIVGTEEIDGLDEIDGLNDGRHVGSFECVGRTDGAFEDVGA